MENKGESENEEKISESNLLRFRLEQRSFILPRYSSGMQRRNFTFTTTLAFSFTEIRIALQDAATDIHRLYFTR